MAAQFALSLLLLVRFLATRLCGSAESDPFSLPKRSNFLKEKDGTNPQARQENCVVRASCPQLWPIRRTPSMYLEAVHPPAPPTFSEPQVSKYLPTSLSIPFFSHFASPRTKGPRAPVFLSWAPLSGIPYGSQRPGRALLPNTFSVTSG